MMAVHMNSWTAVNTTVARLPGVREAVFESANKIAAKAEQRLSAHRKPDDDTSSSIDVSRGTVDSFINLDDDGGGAMGIEFGYRAENGKIVHGLHIITGAAGLA
jgi:hypothetical protein